MWQNVRRSKSIVRADGGLAAGNARRNVLTAVAISTVVIMLYLVMRIAPIMGDPRRIEISTEAVR